MASSGLNDLFILDFDLFYSIEQRAKQAQRIQTLSGLVVRVVLAHPSENEKVVLLIDHPSVVRPSQLVL